MKKKTVAAKKQTKKVTKRPSLKIEPRKEVSGVKLLWILVAVLALVAAVIRLFPDLKTQNGAEVIVVPTPTPTPALKSETATSSATTQTASPSGKVVRVLMGDTFGKLAFKYCGTVKKAEELQTANNYSDPRLLKENDRIVITCTRE